MALCFHRVREAKIIDFYHVDGVRNPTDILSKHWGYQQVWKLLRPLLFVWPGDTSSRMSRLWISQDPGDWYLVAARIYGHQLASTYSHVETTRYLKRMGSDKKHKRIGSRETTRDCDFGFSLRASLAIWIWKFWCGTKATQVYTDLHIFDSLTMVEPMECSAEQRLSLAGVQERRPLIEQIV
jgi:hypothetical protein